MALGTTLAASIANLATALNASASAQTAKNRYNGANTAFSDGSSNLDIWSKTVGPAGAGQAVACSTAGAVIYGTPVLALPDLMVICFGINDVRQGATSQAQLVALLKQAVNRIRGVLPTTDIVLWGPNAFLTDDPTERGPGHATVAGQAAQAYSTILYNAYAALKNVWPNVLVVQKQDLFGKTCVTYAAAGGASGWMTDQIHPSLPAQIAEADWLAPLIGFVQPFNPQRAALARTAAATAGVMPYTIYPREVEDPATYTPVASGLWLGQGTVSSQDYVDILFPGPRSKEVMFGDVVAMGKGGTVFPIPTTCTITNLNSTTAAARQSRHRAPARDLGRHDHDLPPQLRVGRHGPELPAAARDLSLPAALLRGGGGQWLSAALHANQQQRPRTRPASNSVSANDVILCPGIGAITGFTFNAFLQYWQVNKTGTDFTALQNKYCWVVSTVPKREVQESAWEPMRLHIVGTLTSGPSVVKSIAARGAGKVNRVYALLGTAGTSATTVVLKVNGATVVTFVFNIGQTQIGTTTWATPSYFSIVQGQSIEWDITAGTGAADLALVCDVGG